MIDAAPNRSAGNAVVLVVDRDPLELVRLSADLLAEGHTTIVARDLASTRCMMERWSAAGARQSRGRPTGAAPTAAFISPFLDRTDTAIDVAWWLRRAAPRCGRVLITDQRPAWIDDRLFGLAFHAEVRPRAGTRVLSEAIDHAHVLAHGREPPDRGRPMPALPAELTVRE